MRDTKTTNFSLNPLRLISNCGGQKSMTIFSKNFRCFSLHISTILVYISTIHSNDYGKKCEQCIYWSVNWKIKGRTDEDKRSRVYGTEKEDNLNNFPLLSFSFFSHLLFSVNIYSFTSMVNRWQIKHSTARSSRVLSSFYGEIFTA